MDLCTEEPIKRMPTARNPLQLSVQLAESTLLRSIHSSELLMTSVPPEEGQSIQNIYNIFAGDIPLRTKTIGEWPMRMPELQCLHCGGLCDIGPPVPIARHYEAQLDLYWVFGPFCRPCCAFGYICETDSTSKQLAPTAELMRRYFGFTSLQVAPPRAAHKRFGGPLSDGDFYGSTGYTCIKTLQPPFVTFAHYVVGAHTAASENFGAAVLLPQSAGRLSDLSRPKQRIIPLSEKKQSGKSPMILEFLATLQSSNDIKDNSESIDIKTSQVSKKRQILNAQQELTNGKEAPNFLKQFIKKLKQ